MLILFQQLIHIEFSFLRFLLINIYLFIYFRMNMLLIDINEENLFQNLRDQMV